MMIKRWPKLNGVYVTEGLLRQINAYAKIACEEAKRPVECYGYLTRDAGKNPRIATGSFFAYDQDVHSGEVMIPYEAVTRCGNEINAMDKRVVGFWHSHADFGTFHSGIDNANLRRILNRISPYSYAWCNLEAELFPEGAKAETINDKILLRQADKQPCGTVELRIGECGSSQPGLESILGATLKMPARFGFAYSVVVNRHGDQPFAKIGVRDWVLLHRGSEEGNGMDRLYDADLYAVKAKEDVVTDEVRIREDVRSKLRMLQVEQKKVDANER